MPSQGDVLSHWHPGAGLGAGQSLGETAGENSKKVGHSAGNSMPNDVHLRIDMGRGQRCARVSRYHYCMFPLDAVKVPNMELVMGLQALLGLAGTPRSPESDECCAELLDRLANPPVA